MLESKFQLHEHELKGAEEMFYRRKYYLVKSEFATILNTHFKETNLPNQLKHGGKEYVLKNYILEVKNEILQSTL